MIFLVLMFLSRIIEFENLILFLGENGRVSRFNSGDLAGKCADFNSQQKMCFAENFCLPRSSFFVFFRLFVLFRNYLGSGWIFRTKCDFLQVLDLLIFRQKQPGY